MKKLITFSFLLLCNISLIAGDVTILFTNDLHSMFVPHNVRNAEGLVMEMGGYSRLATAIAQVRAAHSQPTFLVDAGDFSSGSLFYSLFPTNCAELQLMAAMGYDATTFGNHEFDFGSAGLADALAAAKHSEQNVPAIVLANIIAVPTNLQTAFDLYGVREYTVVERNDVRIGIFGLIGDEAIEQAPAAAALSFEDRITAAKRVVEQLHKHEKVDLIICLSHSGTSADKGKSEDEHLAKKVPGIDVIVSGHSHTILDEPLCIGQTVIVSAGEYGNFLGELTIDTDTKKISDYRLIPITNTFTDDKSVATAIDSFNEKLNKTYLHKLHRSMSDTVVFSRFYLPAAADSTGESLLGNLVADAFAKALIGNITNQKAFAVVPAGTLRDNLYEGFTNETQLFNILSLGVGLDGNAGYPLVCVYLTGKELKDLCEVDASVSSIMPDAQLFFSGIRYEYNPKNVFLTKVLKVLVEESNTNYAPPDSEKLYPIVAGLYSAQMLSVVGEKTHGLLSIVPKDAQGRPVADYLKQIIKTPDGMELKEWLALSNYLHSLSDKGAITILPERYAQPTQQKIAKPRPSVLLMVVNVFIFFGTLIVVLVIVRKIRKRHE